jgi:predicted nucleic acid-binding protein
MLFVDTSVWSLALRRDRESSEPTVGELRRALQNGEILVTTGVVIQELLQGFNGPKDHARLLERFSVLPFLMPDRQDHIEAAGLRNACRRRGVQLTTIDALLAQLCIRHELTLLTTDQDFGFAAKHIPVKVWRAAT